MKTYGKIFLMVILAGMFFLVGCAQQGPKMTSLKVYRAERDKIVAQNNLEIAQAERQKLNQELAKERERARNNIALTNINSGRKNDGTINSDGIIGGFPCIFVNDSRRNKTLFLESVTTGKKYSLDLVKRNGMKIFDLETGQYLVTWTVENSNTVYPYKNGKTVPDICNVTADPHYWHEKTAKDYHGGYRLFGY